MNNQELKKQSTNAVALGNRFQENKWRVASDDFERKENTNNKKTNANTRCKAIVVASSHQVSREGAERAVKRSSERNIPLSPQRNQSNCDHEIHSYSHRRHYPHHLLDHFSGNLTKQRSSSATWNDILERRKLCSFESHLEIEHEGSGGFLNTEASARDGRNFRLDEKETRELQVSKIVSNDAFPAFGEPIEWPLAGARSRTLPSGQRVSSLKQACFGFVSTSQEPDHNHTINVLCPKVLKQLPSSKAPLPLPSNGPSFAYWTQSRIKRDQSPTKQPEVQECVEFVKCRNGTLHGLSKRQKTAAHKMQSCVASIDNSDIEGRHVVEKAPRINSPQKLGGNQKASLSRSKKRHEMRQLRKQNKKIIRPKSLSPSLRTTASISRCRVLKDQKKTAPKSERSRYKTTLTTIPATHEVQNCLDLDTSQTIPTPLEKQSTSVGRKINTNVQESNNIPLPFSAESTDDFSSLAPVEDCIASTFDELSINISELSGGNFLIDYGDSTKFHFRNEWNVKMRCLDEKMYSVKERIKSPCREQHEASEGVLGILGELENLKLEMVELYDYFDQFEREEDTLLQQVQRQVSQAHLDCRILHYKLEKQKRKQVDKTRVQELEEELRLSRQVAVSLHWELQAADTKQAKLEVENVSLHERLLTAEISSDALRSQLPRILKEADHMSSHAPLKVQVVDNSENTTFTDSVTEMRRQIRFMEEKEKVMSERLIGLNKEKSFLEDAINQYRDNYGELAAALPFVGNRRCDLNLRLKLAEDQSGLLARKVIELQLEIDNMIKTATEKELIAEEFVIRNPSVSDLQFLEDERESLRLALDEMEKENRNLAAELTKYKQAVEHKLRSNSASTDLNLDFAIVAGVPRSSDGAFDEEILHSYSHKNKPKSLIHYCSRSEFNSGDYKKMRPSSLTSPYIQEQNRKHMSLSRTLSDIATPLSPDIKNQSVVFNSTNSSSSVEPPSINLSNRNKKSTCQKCRGTKRVRMVDACVETGNVLCDNFKPSVTASTITKIKSNGETRSYATTSVSIELQTTHQKILDAATQTSERMSTNRSESASLVKPQIMPSTSVIHSTSNTFGCSRRPHNDLLDEMRKQIANVRNIAESMENVVNVEEIDADLEKEGRKVVHNEYRKIKESMVQKRKFAKKMVKFLQKYFQDMEESVLQASERAENAVCDVTAWNLHGNTTCTLKAEDTSTSWAPSVCIEDSFSDGTVHSASTSVHPRTLKNMGLQTVDSMVLVILVYTILSSVDAAAMIQIMFFTLVFFVL